MESDDDNYRLALRAQTGDGNALSELVERTRVRLFALAYAELRHYDDAQDVVVAALHQVCQHIDQLREPRKIDAWMHAIVRNEVRQCRRGSGPVPAPMDPEEAASVPSPMRTCVLRLDIEQALKRLPRDQARVIVLFYWQHRSTREIAAQLDRPEGTIRRWLHRGRHRLALEMKDYAPMKTPQTVAILHTDLSPTALRQLIQALTAGGYQPRVVPPGNVTAVTCGSGLAGPLAEFSLVLLDDFIGGRSALEYVLRLKSVPETASIPVAVLCADPSDFTAGAYFSAGVDRLVDRNRLGERESLQRLDRSLTGKRILVVEDEEITRGQLETALARVGLTVVGMAANGEEAVALALRERPDIVLMDIHMPVMDGLEAARQIQAQFRTCVVLLTASPDLQEAARLAGASGYLTKPVSGTELRRQLQDALDRFHRVHGSEDGLSASPSGRP